MNEINYGGKEVLKKIRPFINLRAVCDLAEVNYNGVKNKCNGYTSTELSEKEKFKLKKALLSVLELANNI